MKTIYYIILAIPCMVIPIALVNVELQSVFLSGSIMVLFTIQLVLFMIRLLKEK